MVKVTAQRQLPPLPPPEKIILELSPDEFTIILLSLSKTSGHVLTESGATKEQAILIYKLYNNLETFRKVEKL